MVSYVLQVPGRTSQKPANNEQHINKRTDCKKDQVDCFLPGP